MPWARRASSKWRRVPDPGSLATSGVAASSAAVTPDRRRAHARTGDDMLRYAAAALFVLLVAAWLTVAVRTVRDGARGRLFRPAAPAPAAVPVPVPVP